MTKYRAKRYFMIETEHIRIEVNRNSLWDYLGFANGFIVLHRKNVFVDIPEDSFERYFIELKEQNK